MAALLTYFRSFDRAEIIFGVLALALVIVVVWLGLLERRLKRFLAGRNAQSLEALLGTLGSQVNETDQTNEEIKRHLVKMEERLQRSIQHVKVIRFNPFRDQGQGSNQSFAVSLLNERGDGAVISTLYARDKVGVYAKPIVAGDSEHELTEEEKASLK